MALLPGRGQPPPPPPSPPTDSPFATPLNPSSWSKHMMDWLAENWFFVLLLLAFIALHLFGHGHGHGGHGRHREG
ncbi:MAG: hypothetical protein KatS3mg050_4771 [Litorilinea sp.]|nr:MAG: hypothetical protein KatS3mg050_4771 [Litorilinea sp.]